VASIAAPCPAAATRRPKGSKRPNRSALRMILQAMPGASCTAAKRNVCLARHRYWTACKAGVPQNQRRQKASQRGWGTVIQVPGQLPTMPVRLENPRLKSVDVRDLEVDNASRLQLLPPSLYDVLWPIDVFKNVEAGDDVQTRWRKWCVE